MYVSISTSVDYTAWDEWPLHDADATMLSMTANNMNETVALENHVSQDWNIRGIRVNYFARNTLSTSDEKIEPILVIGGTMYRGSTYQTRPGIGYPGEFHYGEWLTNPATDNSWSWTELDSIEAGVRSVQVGLDWTGELRVTQLVVTVYADKETSTFALHTTETWAIQNVTLTAVCRSDIDTTNDEVNVVLVYPDYEPLTALNFRANTTWSTQRVGYDKNPWAPENPWSWDDIDILSAGVTQNLVGSEWTGEFYITQLYLEVFGYAPPGNFTGMNYPQKWAVIVESPQEGLSFSVTVQNQGTFAETNVWVALYCGATVIGNRTISSMPSGTTTKLVFTWVVDGVYNGTYTLSARVKTLPNEYDTVDNLVSTHTWWYYAISPPYPYYSYYGQYNRDSLLIVRVYHDVTPSVVSPEAITPTGIYIAYKGYDRDIYVTVKNQGSRDESFSVTAKYGATVIGTQSVTNLAPGATQVLNFTWTTTGLSYGYYVISAETTLGTDQDPSDDIRTANVMLTIPGDLDGDRDVDGVDFGLFAPAYGSVVGQPAYKILADIDNSDAVDGLDFGIFAPNYGKSW
jgi:hypothetical protein